jgi:DHA3 family macrolide efflux protein-like MFS transporter
MSYNGIFFNIAVLLGGAFMMIRKQWKRKALLIIGSQYLSIIAWFLIALAGFGFPFWFVYIAGSLTGLYVSIYGTTYRTIFHETIPPDKLGRVFSVDFAISFFLGPFATLASGPLADWLGLEELYMGIAIIAMVFMTLMVIFSKYRLVGKDALEKTNEQIEIKEIPEPVETV